MKINNFIQSIEFGLNNHCSLQCPGCPSQNPDSSRKTNLDFSRVIPVIKDLNLREIVICGNSGEPLEHPEIAGILESLTETFPEASIHLSTNGLNAEVLQRDTLKNIRDRVLFQVAVDGSKEEIHTLTRRKGSLAGVLKGIRYLLDHGMKVVPVFSRHALNEDDALAAARMLKEMFRLELTFRDTTIVSEHIKPPLKISKNGDVSILYSKTQLQSWDYVPNTKHLYIEYNGDCYPCVSFTKYKSALKAISIYDYENTISFLKDFLTFQKTFCEDFQKCGDKRYCELNCGIYRFRFKYDLMEDLKLL